MKKKRIYPVLRQVLPYNVVKIPNSFKLIFLFLLITAVSFTTNATAQRITIALKNAKIEQVFSAITKHTGLKVAYSKQVVDTNRRISVNMNDAEVDEILNQVIAGTELGYEISDGKIYLFDKKAIATSQQQKRKTVTGVIKDQDGETVIGATVMEKGTSNGVTTDVDGNFTITLPANSTLQISYLGYLTQELFVRDKDRFIIELIEDIQNLDEVVVIGYGRSSKRDLTSSVSTIDTDKLQNLPVGNITQGLAGRAAGIIVTQSGGGVNQKSTISIRGGGTPLVVIDGFISNYSDFENLNIDDIESMSILKDASATAVYGANAGNGVLVVQTKSGSKGLRIDYSYNQSWSKPTYLEKKLDSYERAVFDNTVRDMYNMEARWTDEEIKKYRTGSDPYNYPNTDWQKLMLRSYTPESKHSFALRGGTDINKFYASFQAYDQESMYRAKSEYYKQYNFRMNEVVELKDLGLKVDLGLNGYISKYRAPRSQYGSGYFHTWSHIQNSSPMLLAYNPFGQIYIGYDNPLAEVSKESGYNKNIGKVLQGNASVEWDVYGVTGLKLRAAGNYRFYTGDSKVWTKTAPQYDLEGTRGPDYPVSLSYSNNSYRDYTLQLFANYDRTFIEDHNVSATFGYEQSYGFSRGFSALRKNYIFMIDQMGAGPSDTMENSGSESEVGSAGFVGRFAYNYKKKYYAEGSMRRDGSDLFPEGNRWGTFFSGTLAYAISEESFFDTLKEKNILNFLKLRASYGEVGLLDGINRFSYLSSYGMTERGYVLDGKIVPTFSEGALISDDITWYTRYMTNLGVDFSTLGGRLAGTVEYFYMRTKGYLTSPSNVGYTDPLGLSLPNIKSDGEHRRAGVDVSLSWKDQVGDFHYEVGGNLSYFDQLIAVAWDEDLSSQKNPIKRQVQQKGYWGVGYYNQGFYKNSADVMNSPRRDASSNLVAGDIKYKDLNGDGIIDGNDQTRIGKNGFPRGNYGIFGNFGYKGFSLNMLFQGATSRDMYLDDVVRGQSTSGYTMVYPYQLDYWMPENRKAKFPRAAMNSSVNGSNNYVTSDYWMVNGKYIRLKTLQIGYDFREKLLKNVRGLYKLQLVLSGNNLFTISPATKYGFDPENGSTNNYDYPVQRTYSVSINIGI